MTRSEKRSTAKSALIVLAVLASMPLAAFAFLFCLAFALDEAWARWPRQTELVELWGREILRIGRPTYRYTGAMVGDGGEGLMRFMHRAGFDPDAEVAEWTVLTFALDIPPGDTVSPAKLAIVLEAGADPDRRDGRGASPIVLAASNGRIEHLRLLLDHGARPDATSSWGANVLDGLADRDVLFVADAVDLLLSRGLDPCATVGATGDVAIRRPMAAHLAAIGLPDLAARAEAACAARGGGRDGGGAPPAH